MPFVWASFLALIATHCWGAPASTEPPDWLHASAAVSYVVVGAVSVIMIVISWNDRATHVLVATLSINSMAAIGYALASVLDLEPRVDAFGRPFRPLRNATWLHTMPLMCVLCGHVFAASVDETLEESVDSLARIAEDAPPGVRQVVLANRLLLPDCRPGGGHCRLRAA